MKKTRIVLTALCAALSITFLSVFVHGDNINGYDSTNDPLVSLSYVEKISAEYDAKLVSLTARLDALEKENSALKTALDTSSKSVSELKEAISALQSALSESSDYEVICLKKGSTLYADSVCEVILRSGKAEIIAPSINGIADLTSGSDLANSAAVPTQHSLLIPRGGDGRGVKVTSDEAYIMVRGAHHVVDEQQ